MTAKTLTAPISRRTAFSLIIAALGVGTAATTLGVSEAEAQTAGMNRREGRREGRQDRRGGRRDARDTRRAARRN